MPMPPPRPSTEGARDPQLRHEIAQLVRAVADRGPATPEALADAVGARYWEPGRFDQALRLAISDGRIVRSAEGLLQRV